MKYLGHVFSAKGTLPNEDKIEVVRNWAILNDVTKLRQFLGIALSYRRYIHYFADIAGPLHQLTHERVPFTWSAECQKAFKQLKEALSTAPVLVYPQFHANAGQFVLHTDASESGLGCVLEQDNRVVAYASRSWTKRRNITV